MTLATLSPNGLDRYGGASLPQALLVATIDGVIELRANGTEWTMASRGLVGAHVSSLAIDARDRVFAGTHGQGVFVRDASGAWLPCSTGLASRNVYSLAASRTPRRDSRCASPALRRVPTSHRRRRYA